MINQSRIKHIYSSEIKNELREACKEKVNATKLSKKENWGALKNEINNSKLMIKSNIEVDSIKDIIEG